MLAARCEKTPARTSEDLQGLLQAACSADSRLTEHVQELVDGLDAQLIAVGQVQACAGQLSTAGEIVV